MRPRINEKMTRREMKQLKILIDPEIAEAYKQMCIEQNSSINIELVKYITEQVNEWIDSKQQVLASGCRKLSYDEQIEVLKKDPLWKETESDQ